jgi:hypothetical protein
MGGGSGNPVRVSGPPGVTVAPSGLEGIELVDVGVGSPSYSADGMTPNSPLPARKTVMQTIRVARFQAWA